mmetsp:Transcript_4901/g.7340  ORF Transcript_4901/g.7340 Transcript_4901/m.7340 type:complete len:97 (-) Transcript_4901:101-391(-)
MNTEQDDCADDFPIPQEEGGEGMMQAFMNSGPAVGEKEEDPEEQKLWASKLRVAYVCVDKATEKVDQYCELLQEQEWTGLKNVNFFIQKEAGVGVD